MAGLANQFGYLRARGVTHGNANFLHSLTTQLGVAPDQALGCGTTAFGRAMIDFADRRPV